MRVISSERIIEVVRKLCIDANCNLPQDVKISIESMASEETWPQAKEILDRIIQNYQIAQRDCQPICQDTGLACVFVSVGQDVHIDGNLTDAIHEGVRRGYMDGYLRKSVVRDPIDRVNTGDNTPAMIYYDIVPGDKVEIIVAPKGAGSENMSQIKMLKPSDGAQGIKDFIMQVVDEAGPNPCPPIVVGVGVGGTFDKAAFLAKKALLRNLDERNPDPFWSQMETELLQQINELGIGPQGFGGKTTALCVNIEQYPAHIASLPVAVNINCHVTRHKKEVI